MSKKSERVRNISKLGKNLLTWEIFQAKLQVTVIKQETNPRLSFKANVCKIRHTYREPFPVRRWVCSFPKAGLRASGLRASGLRASVSFMLSKDRLNLRKGRFVSGSVSKWSHDRLTLRAGEKHPGKRRR